MPHHKYLSHFIIFISIPLHVRLLKPKNHQHLKCTKKKTQLHSAPIKSDISTKMQ
uniref:Uncharacterized protein n=1 Tax=Arundo donax TaxID=35708 RepID=A0A0A9FMZ9_ARUDO